MARKIILLVAVLFMFVSPGLASDAPGAQTVWVSKEFKGPPQCMDNEEIERVYSNGANTMLNDSRMLPELRKPEDISKVFEEQGIRILETRIDNRPVCSACYQCPAYDKLVSLLILKLDLEKAGALGFLLAKDEKENT